MNNNDDQYPPVPPPVPSQVDPNPPGGLPPGENPEDHIPVHGLMGAVESILREPRRVMYQLRQGGAVRMILGFLLITMGCGLVYGFVVGTFSGGTQLWASPVKVTIGVLLSTLICLPSLYIFSCLAGSPARLVEIIGLVSGLMAMMTILLVGFAPVAWVFSQSTQSLLAMGLLHMVFWLIATWFGLRFLNHGFGFLSDRSGGLKVWVVVFVLVMLQMTTALRPLIGTSTTFLPEEKKFFLAHWFDNLSQDSEARRSGANRASNY